MERNLMVAGFGGQGVMTLGKFLAEATCESTDKNVTFFPSYGAEQRGGTANCYVVISDDDIGAPLGDQMDDLIVMNDPSLSKFLYKLVPGGTLYINSSIVKSEITRTDIKVVKAPVTELALEMGSAQGAEHHHAGCVRGLYPGGSGGRGVAHHRTQAGQKASAAAAEPAGL